MVSTSTNQADVPTPIRTFRASLDFNKVSLSTKSLPRFAGLAVADRYSHGLPWLLYVRPWTVTVRPATGHGELKHMRQRVTARLAGHTAGAARISKPPTRASTAMPGAVKTSFKDSVRRGAARSVALNAMCSWPQCHVFLAATIPRAGGGNNTNSTT